MKSCNLLNSKDFINLDCDEAESYLSFYNKNKKKIQEKNNPDNIFFEINKILKTAKTKISIGKLSEAASYEKTADKLIEKVSNQINIKSLKTDIDVDKKQDFSYQEKYEKCMKEKIELNKSLQEKQIQIISLQENEIQLQKLKEKYNNLRIIYDDCKNDSDKQVQKITSEYLLKEYEKKISSLQKEIQVLEEAPRETKEAFKNNLSKINLTAESEKTKGTIQGLELNNKELLSKVSELKKSIVIFSKKLEDKDVEIQNISENNEKINDKYIKTDKQNKLLLNENAKLKNIINFKEEEIDKLLYELFQKKKKT